MALQTFTHPVLSATLTCLQYDSGQTYTLTCKVRQSVTGGPRREVETSLNTSCEVQDMSLLVIDVLREEFESLLRHSPTVILQYHLDEARLDLEKKLQRTLRGWSDKSDWIVKSVSVEAQLRTSATSRSRQ